MPKKGLKNIAATGVKMLNNGNCQKMFELIFLDDLVGLKEMLKFCDASLIAEDGESLLIYATMMERVFAVDALLKAGADVYFKNMLGDNAMHIAAKKGYLEIVKLISRYQNDLDIRGQDGFTALNYAIFFGNFDVAFFLARDKLASQDVADDVFNLTPRERAAKVGWFF